MYRTVNEFLQPYTLLCLLALGGCVNLWRRRVETRCRLLLLTVPLVALVSMSLPPAAHLAHWTLERKLTARTKLPEGNQAMVVLGGWSMPADDRRPRPQLGRDSIYRCLHAAELYHRSGACPVVVSGGVAEPQKRQPAVGPLMKKLLVELGVAPGDVLVEGRSTTTYENAVECRRILSERGVERITLVTDANHMLRAARCFGRMGFEVTSAPCSFDGGTLDLSVSSLLPNIHAAHGCAEVAHEWLGLIWYWLHDRI